VAQEALSPPRVSRRSRPGGSRQQSRYEKELANGAKEDDLSQPQWLGPWLLGETIGKGTSGLCSILLDFTPLCSAILYMTGRVRIAKHKRTGKLAAVKIIPKLNIHGSRISLSTPVDPKLEKAMFSIQREMVIMKLISHPNVMSMYDVWEGKDEMLVTMLHFYRNPS
jgi:hypothetical protein